MRALFASFAFGLLAFASVSHAQEAAATPAPPEPRKPNAFSFAQHDVVAFGTNEDGFMNATVGARIDYAATPVLKVGFEVAYANLEAEPQRAHSVLALFQFEARATLNDTWSVPARIGVGHLAANGPVLRLAAGLALKLASRLEVVLEVAPTFFTTEDGVYPAIGPGLELSFRY